MKAVVEAVGREIETMNAPKTRKQELVRALMLNVSALSSNLQVRLPPRIVYSLCVWCLLFLLYLYLYLFQ